MTKQTSFPKNKIKILLLENIHPAAKEKLTENGYVVEEAPKSLSGDELASALQDVYVLGIRSKTKVTAEHLQKARRLMVVGCFGVGTNQVAIDAATSAGVPVFNAPFSSTRSVAELAVADILMLARRIGDANNAMHQRLWQKSAKGAYEIRGKTVGIVGYGHIGEQVGLLAESMGLKIIFYDKTKRLPLGNARPVESMEELLAESDFVTLHVPAQGGKPLISEKELAGMKRGSYLINLGRGTLVDLPALRKAVESKALGGAAIDVYPKEPQGNNEPFDCELAGVPNIILTPHIGGSTEEAQRMIALEVAESFIDYIDNGATMGAVNFPQINLPAFPNSHRILNVHKNVPGVLTEVNKIVSEVGANIDSQYLSTYKDVGYLIMDLNKDLSEEVKEKIAELPTSIKTRILY